MQYSLDPKFNTKKVDSGMNNVAVKTALKLIQDSNETNQIQDNKNYWIEQLFENGFNVVSPNSVFKLSPQLLQQALWQTVQRMKPLDFQIHGSGRPQYMEQLVTQATGTVLTRGGYVSALRDKNGAFYNSLMYGDAFVHVGANPEKSGVPILFNPISNSNVYTDQYATMMRIGTTAGRSVTKCCVIFSMSWSEAVRQYPELKRRGSQGRIPRDMNGNKEIERDWEQTTRLDDITEIAYFYDTTNYNHTVFAGSQCTVLKEYKGKKKAKGDKGYPFMLNDMPYIPVLQHICMPSMQGFFNHGLGDMLYQMAIVSNKLMNLAIGHVTDNTDPVTLVNLPKSEASTFFNKLKLAQEMRQAGRRPMVALTYDENAPGASQISANALLTPSMFGEFQAMWEAFTREMGRLGINIDQVERGTATATQILAEEEASNAFVKQVMENNASESEFAINITLDMMETAVSKRDKTPLNLTSFIEVKGERIRPDGMTLGQIQDELSKHHYFTKVNSRSGAIPSNVAQQAKLSRVLAVLPPGSPGQMKAIMQLAQLNDQDLSMEDLGMTPAQPDMQGMEQMPEANIDDIPPVTPTDTDRLSPNPRSAQLTPSI
jgi:hypothetical protein